VATLRRDSGGFFTPVSKEKKQKLIELASSLKERPLLAG